MTSTNLLAHYDPNFCTKVVFRCKLSWFGSHAVEWHITYASRVLSNIEIKYSQTNKETLSIIFGVKQFNQYLYGHHFHLVTNHRTIISIFGKKKGILQIPANRLQDWAYFLSAYDYDISYVKSQITAMQMLFLDYDLM